MTNEYIELWKDLGIDLERHEQLLNGLSEYVKEAILSQKNRPAGMDYFNFVLSEIHGLRIKELAELKKQGKKIIGAFCLYAPEEIAYAADATMIGLCGGSNFPIADAEKILPTTLCPLIKSSFGFKLSRTCPYAQMVDLLVGETTCDGKKKTYEIMGETTPTYVMEIPQKPKTVQAKRLWLEEIKALKKEAKKLTDNKITTESLKESIGMINGKRRALKRLFELRKKLPSPISGLDGLLVSQVSFYDDVKRFTAKTNELCDELEKRATDGIGVADKDATRILVTGCPMAIPNWKLHSIVETLNASIVIEESCIGTRGFSDLVEPKGDSMNDLLKALVERYSKITCACFTPNVERLDTVVQLAKDYKVDGVIYYTLQNCTTYNIEAIKIEKALKKHQFPMLKIEDDYGMSQAQIKTRVEAFLEMIQAKK